MKTASLTPCTNWVERLSVRNYDELSYADSVALHEHLAMCSSCATAYSAYQSIGNHINSLSPVTPLDGLPYELLQLQHAESSLSSKERLAAMFRCIAIHLVSLFAIFTLFLQKVDYVSDTHYCYALRDTSGFLLWRYKKSDVFFSSPSIKDGIAYMRASDAPLFQFAARVRPCGSSFLWKC